MVNVVEFISNSIVSSSFFGSSEKNMASGRISYLGFYHSILLNAVPVSSLAYRKVVSQPIKVNRNNDGDDISSKQVGC